MFKRSLFNTLFILNHFTVRFLRLTILFLIIFLVSCSSVSSNSKRGFSEREVLKAGSTSKPGLKLQKGNSKVSKPKKKKVNVKSTSIYPVNSEVFETPITKSSLAASESSDSTVSKVDKFTSFYAHRGQILSLSTSKEGREVFSGGADGKLVRSRVIENSKGQKVVSSRVLAKSAREILSLSISPDSKVLAIGQYSSITLFDLKNLKILGQLTRIRGRVDHITWTQSSKQILFGLSSGQVYSWNLWFEGAYAKDSLYALEQYRGANSPIVGLASHPGGEIFFGAEKSGRIIVWRFIEAEEKLGLREKKKSGKELKVSRSAKLVASLPIEISSLSISDDANYIYALTLDGFLRSWKVRGLKPHNKLQVENEGIVSFSELAARGSSGKNSLFAFLTRRQRIVLLCDNHEGNTQDISSISQNKFLFSSEVFKTPFSQLTSASKRPVLWASQKNGAILMLDLEQSGIKANCQM